MGREQGGVRLGSPLLQWACAFPECSAEPGGRGAIPVLPSLSLTALVSSVNSRGPTCPCFGLQQSCPPTKLLPVGVLSHLAGQVSRAATSPVPESHSHSSVSHTRISVLIPADEGPGFLEVFIPLNLLAPQRGGAPALPGLPLHASGVFPGVGSSPVLSGEKA